MRFKFSKPDIYLGFLGILISYHLIVNFIWISLSSAPVPWDQSGHTRLAIQFADYFTSFGFLRIIDYFSISTYYPPLIHTLIGFLVIFTGHPIKASEIVVTLFFGLSIFLVYIYSLDLFKNNRIALISAVIFSFLPIIYEHSRWFLLEIPQIAFIILSLIFLNRSRNFSDSKNTKYFFIALSLAVLTKWTSLVYLFIPSAISFYFWIKENKANEKILQSSIFKYIAVFLIITLPWYIFNFSTFIPQLLPNLQGESSDPSALFSLQNFLFYIYLFVNFQMTIYLAIIFIIASFYFFAIKKYKHKLLLGGTIFFIYLLFSFISNKDWRYTMPALLFAVIIIGLFLNDFMTKFKILGKVCFVILTLFLLSYHVLLSFRPQTLSYQRAIELPVIGWLDYININDNLVHSYNQIHWPQREILSDLNVSHRIWLLCLVDQERFNCSNLILERELLKLKELNIEPPPVTGIDDKESIDAQLSKFSYVLLVENKIGNPATRNLDIILKLKSAVEQSSEFKKIKGYDLPNGDRAYLYERQ